VGRRSFKLPTTPALLSLYYGINSETLTEETGYYFLERDGVYDIVIQNYPACNKVCEQHGWHMHGHKFWILGTGKGEWTASDEQIASLNTEDPILRDTVISVPDATKVDVHRPCGWTYLRFVAKNPGVWYFHCHQAWHVLMGMNVAFVTAMEDVGPPPEDMITCGDVTRDVVFAKEETQESECDSGDSISVAAVVLISLGTLILGVVMTVLRFSMAKPKIDENHTTAISLQSDLKKDAHDP